MLNVLQMNSSQCTYFCRLSAMVTFWHSEKVHTVFFIWKIFCEIQFSKWVEIVVEINYIQIKRTAMLITPLRERFTLHAYILIYIHTHLRPFNCVLFFPHLSTMQRNLTGWVLPVSFTITTSTIWICVWQINSAKEMFVRLFKNPTLNFDSVVASVFLLG